MSATAVASTEILVTWEEIPAIDENGVITIYEVEFVPLETFDGQIATNSVNISDLNATLTDLEEYVEYNISVRAYTSVGPGPYSDPVTNRTLEDSKKRFSLLYVWCATVFCPTGPASPPLNVTVTNITSTTIAVVWDLVVEIERNGIITVYEVEYNQSTFPGVNSTQTLIVTSTMAQLARLHEYVDYFIRVRAHTRVGPGPYSSDINTTTAQDGR